ncbi:alpha/beta fold hydrolase [Sinirhodobacter populi]|uniref:Alpha/beta fold hydrolase n=1 Tax=Paenirhodobacter populi TaxID=2306993 RepID=A0A443K7E0_9RHOB|nr:alpha/beta fold hydrolase [Sinirhodobacter populi]RWR28688.1 alpha/beta fold hydrolase [Sinirhodobacter populi]
MRSLVLVIAVVLAGCSPRGELAYGPLPEARTLPVFVGSTRAPAAGDPASFDWKRSEALRLARFDVAVPPDHQPGTLEIPNPRRSIDPRRDFLVARSEQFRTDAAFRADLRRQLARSGGEAVVFVHGYNTNFAEGLFRFTQLAADFDLEGALVHYAWPSRAQVMGYAYDHDSVLFSRDGLTDLLHEVRAAGAKRIILVGHSMGGFLTMEALRQLALQGDRATLGRIAGVVLISPDIDVGVFRSQARDIGALPQPFIVFTSQRDRALGLSARVAGEDTRLGNLHDINPVADLRVMMVDTAAYDTRGGHFNIGNSPALIRLLRGSQGLAKTLERDQSRHHDPFARAALTVRNATQIVLQPLEAIGDAIN